MNYFSNRLYSESELAQLIDTCIMHLQAVKYHPNIKADERDEVLQQIQNVLPEIRRYLTVFRTREISASSQPPYIPPKLPT